MISEFLSFMKTSSKLLSVILFPILTVLSGAAADPVEAVGYLRLVNAIAAGSGNVSVRVDGQKIYANGYRFGAVTGGFGLAPGIHKLEVQRDGVKAESRDVTVVKNLTQTLVAYAEKIPTADGKLAFYQAQLKALTPRDVAKGKVATFVSVSRKPLLRVDVRGPGGKWQPVEVPRLRTAETPILLARGYVALISGGRPLDAIPVAEPGNYVVVLFDDARGRLHTVSFRDDGELTGD